MNWVCPNCSNSNSDEQSECFVCGMERPTLVDKSDTDDRKIFFSDFEAFRDTLKNLFRQRKSEEEPSLLDGSESYKDRKDTKKVEEVHKKEEEPRVKKISLFGSDFAEPWPEHKIKFDIAAIRAKGFVRSEQETMGGVNGYLFYKEDGSTQFIRLEMILVQKMAHKV